MYKIILIIMSIISCTILTLSSTCTNSYASSSKPAIEYPPDVLPSLMMTYNYLIKGYE
jgi:hypothetical protein